MLSLKPQNEVASIFFNTVALHHVEEDRVDSSIAGKNSAFHRVSAGATRVLIGVLLSNGMYQQSAKGR